MQDYSPSGCVGTSLVTEIIKFLNQELRPIHTVDIKSHLGLGFSQIGVACTPMDIHKWEVWVNAREATIRPLIRCLSLASVTLWIHAVPICGCGCGIAPLVSAVA